MPLSQRRMRCESGSKIKLELFRGLLRHGFEWVLWTCSMWMNMMLGTKNNPWPNIANQLILMDLKNKKFFDENIGSCLDRLYNTALRLTRNPDHAEDLVAEAVMRGLENIDSLQDRDRFVHWLIRILTNCFISQYRKAESRIPHESYSEEAIDDDVPFSIFERLHQPFLLWWGTPEQEFLNNTLCEDISRALDALPDNYRVAVLLSDVEGFTYEEIAKTLDVPTGTVRSRLARGRSLLQKSLWQHALDRGLVSK